MSVIENLKSFFKNAFADSNEFVWPNDVYERTFVGRKSVVLDENAGGTILELISWSGKVGDGWDWIHPMYDARDFIAGSNGIVIPFAVRVGYMPGSLNVTSAVYPTSAKYFAQRPSRFGQSRPIENTNSVKCKTNEIVYGSVVCEKHKRNEDSGRMLIRFEYELEYGYKGATRTEVVECLVRIKDEGGTYNLVLEKKL